MSRNFCEKRQNNEAGNSHHPSAAFIWEGFFTKMTKKTQRMLALQASKRYSDRVALRTHTQRIQNNLRNRV
jgi:hypothetical protein